ncbi:hypothetical protein GGR53DRAFT_463759 [Hypoxylon sp. FL1150]|nr:hypothetical protein GGR53DRAFT_463759 [Hypoxylon sp. FL1150]
MKITIIFRHIIAAVGATLVLAKPNELELVTGSNDTNGNNTNTAATTIPSAPLHLNDNSTTMWHFDLASSNTGPMAHTSEHEHGDWVIPVSHWACTEWPDLGDLPMRSAISALVKWGSSPWHWIDTKTMHYEMGDDFGGPYGAAGAFVCNCKLCCIDRVPASEMWEFYERIRANCGVGRSGWIFSKKWDKGYAVTSSKYIDDKRTKTNLCPPNCSVM